MNFVKGSWHLHFILVMVGICAVRTFEIIKLPIGLNIAFMCLRSYNLTFFNVISERKYRQLTKLINLHVRCQLYYIHSMVLARIYNLLDCPPVIKSFSTIHRLPSYTTFSLWGSCYTKNVQNT